VSFKISFVHSMKKSLRCASVKLWVLHNSEIIAVIMLFLLVKFVMLTKIHHVGWDEAVYLGMGKYIYSFGGVGLWEIIRPPGLPLILGIAWKLGVDQILIAELVMNIAAAGNIFLVYLIGKEISGKHVGITSAIILAVTPIFFSDSSLIMTGIPSTTFALGAFYLFILNKQSFWIGLLIAISTIFRFPQGLLFPIFLVLVISSNAKLRVRLQKVITLTLGFILVLIPFFIINYLSYRQQVTNIFQASLLPLILGSMHQANPFYQGTWFFYVNQIFQQNALLSFSLVGILLAPKKPKIYLLTAMVPFIIYFSVIANKQARFMLIFLPYLAILAAVGIYKSAIFVSSKSKNLRINKMIVTSIFILIIGTLFIPVLRADFKDYTNRANSHDPKQVFFKSLEKFNGVFLTMDPRPVASVDQLFVPMYNSPRDALRTYSQMKESAEYILYYPQFYSCIDELCDDLKEQLKFMILSNELILFNEIGDEQHYFFRIA
jgi:4-amino-4-deoxy-L-arabinose transferase-like glycosyltransferase